MKILYDHQIFDQQNFGGISRYFCELIEGINNLDKAEVDISLKYSKNYYLKKSQFSYKANNDPGSYENFITKYDFKGKWNIYAACNKFIKPVKTDLVNKLTSIDALKMQNFDVFHPTYYDDYFLPYIGSKPFVLTVHDMIHEIYPESFSLLDQVSKQKRGLAKMANMIVTVSEKTKKDLIRFFGISPEKIVVTYLATSMNSVVSRMEPSAIGFILPERYILFVGARTIYKNFYFFINSMRLLMSTDPTLHIVCTGGSFSENEKIFLGINGIIDRVHQHAASDTELEHLYQQALAFVFPSLYEGFGIPVLEAFSNACPAVLANAGSLPEIGGDAAVYFEPKDAQSVHSAMSEVLYNSGRRTELVALGKKRLQQFSWRRTCTETEAVYRALAAGT